jgi:hypothetical protein
MTLSLDLKNHAATVALRLAIAYSLQHSGLGNQ